VGVAKFKEEHAMRCRRLSILALSTLALAVSPSGLRAADDVRPAYPSEADTTEAIQLLGLSEVVAASKDVDQDSTTAAPGKAKTAVPTPAKRKAASGLSPIGLDSTASQDPTVPAARSPIGSNAPKKSSSRMKGMAIDVALNEDPADAASSNPESSGAQTKDDGKRKAKGKADDKSLQPIPDPMEAGQVNIEAASFKGIVPGTSTKEDVTKAWGQPKEIANQDDNMVQLYSVKPFDRVEVHYLGEKVSSLVIRFDRPFPVDAVAKQLDLTAVRPVLVSNELGETLGQAYPERGVLFAFEAGKEPDKPSMKVSQLVLEPVTAEPFVLRAEASLEKRNDLSRRDLEQALSLDKENARAYWLYGRILVTMGQSEKAATAAKRAVQLDPDDCRYRVTLAQVMAQAGQLTEALAEARKAAEVAEKRLHVKARALCLVGDLLASGPKPDYKQAITFHTQALQMADPLSSDPHPAIRVAAKEVLIDAHLGAAHDIAWGDWKEKNKAVARWLERALAVAEDLAKNEGGHQDQVFRVYARAMAAYVGIRGGIDPEPTVNAVVGTGDEAIAATRDPVQKAQLQWDVGMALYDAVQIAQMRSDHANALKYGEQAADYLAKANEVKQSTSSAFLLGRLYFRLGTIHAIRDKDHKAAIVWFDKAVPLLERPSIEELSTDLGRHGESFVSMAVSYWEAGQRQKAVTMNEKGIKWMEQAVEQGSLDKSALVVPYNNLAAMHRKLGSTEKADRFQDMASRAKKEKLK
jgi:tetratricopeptide (TPR) repeat protein